MFARFIVLIQPDHARRAELVAKATKRTGFIEVVDTGSFTVLLEAGSRSIALPDGRGIILGRLFSKNDRFTEVTEIDEDTASELVKSHGLQLLNRNWGTYLALLCLQDAGLCALRDPSGGLPCYFWRCEDGLVLASDAQVLADAGLLDPAIEWEQVKRYLATGSLRTGATCLRGLNEVLPGFRLEWWRGEIALDAAWSPWSFVAPVDDRPDREIAIELRETVKRSTQALASGFEHILVTVSGGLDSSIVASALQDHSRPFECLTMATRAAEGDERQYARILTDNLGVKLHEAEYHLGDIDLTASQGLGLPRPIGMLFDQSYQAEQRRLVSRYGVEAIFGGSGGDNVFCLTQSALPLLDRLAYEGLGRGTWQTLDDICRLTGASIWVVLRVAINRLLSTARRRSSRITNQFLIGDPTQIAEELHPWLEAPAGAPLGKLAHVAGLARAQVALDSTLGIGWPPSIRPLLSQPVMELCLKVPSWRWISGGRDRAIARQAFATELPTRLINRRTKGGPDAFSVEVVEENRAEILRLLQQGLLNNNGIIDMHALSSLLHGDRPIGAPDHIHVTRLVAAEAWARAWTATPARSEENQGARRAS